MNADLKGSFASVFETRPQSASLRHAGSIAFYPVKTLHLPHNYREFYLSRELAGRGWKVSWLRPASGRNEGVSLEWPTLPIRDLDYRARTYFYPAYLAKTLIGARTALIWLSGWNIRSLKELWWLVSTLKLAGIRIIYDPIDPICEFDAAQGRVDPEVQRHNIALANKIYSKCDRVVCVTPEMRELLAANGAPRDRLIVGRWGTDASLFDPTRTMTDLRSRLGLDRNTFLVGWLGTMEPFKGLDEVILPLVEETSGMGLRLHFVLAGRGTLESRLRLWVAERPHLPITILPTVPYAEAPAFTGSLDAYLVPTNPVTEYARSICPIKCFDALAMGTPLITTRTPATEFLTRYEDLVSLAEFSLESFRVKLLDRYQRWSQAPSASRHGGIQEVSHQSVSRLLADEIDRLVRITR